jgi:ferredoxin-NADP reductase
MNLVVVARTDEADDVISLRLARPDGGRLAGWRPGAHIDVRLSGGLVRQYSLTGVVGDDLWEIAVLRSPRGRGGSQHIFDTICEGSIVQVGGPRNHFALEPAKTYLFIAGGIGITPIRTMLAAADAAGCQWRLLYGGRTESSMAFVAELSARYADRVLVHPEDRCGLLDIPAFLDNAPAGTLVYCCGPEPLLAAVEGECAVRPECDLRVERFAPAEPASASVDSVFEVDLVQTGVTLRVPAGVSILAAAEQAGAFVTSSCEQGTCGSCETVVLAGVPDHRDSVLTDAQRVAGDSMMICVSRAAGDRLVLDL